MYIVTSTVIYRYGGPNVESPSLGSTEPLVEKVAYGIALPTVSVEFNNTRPSVADEL